MNTNPTEIRPTWVRMPRNGTLCPYSGMTRGSLYKLCASGAIKSAIIGNRESRRRVRLVNYDSLMAFIAAHAEPVKQETAPAA